MKLQQAYGYDEEKASDGVWVELPKMGGWVKVRMMGTLAYDEAINKASRKYLRKIRSNTLTAKDAYTIACTVLADEVLCDWKEIEEDGTGAVPFSRTNALRILQQYKGFKEDVETVASDPTNFEEDVEADSANLSTTSDGTSTSETSGLSS